MPDLIQECGFHVAVLGFLKRVSDLKIFDLKPVCGDLQMHFLALRDIMKRDLLFCRWALLLFHCQKTS